MTIKGLECPHCKSTDTTYHDGALGYEAVRCNACNIETDLNNPANYSGRTDNRTHDPKKEVYL